MIPSDHFVKFYNEVFKFLEDQSEEDLRNYWLEISRHQQDFLLERFKAEGFAGMKAYWDEIIFEENLDAEATVTDDYFEMIINHCPSLAKAKDNDAGQMLRYCDHCGGWVQPLMAELGYTLISDIIDRQEPSCAMRVYKDKALAASYRKTCKLPADPYDDWQNPEEGEA